MSLVLRDYQERGRQDIRLEFKRRRKRVLYVLPTGGGKTVMYATVAEGVAQRGKRAVILEHRKELIRQASLALARMGIVHRVVASRRQIEAIRDLHVEELGWPMLDHNAPVVVASVQTLGRRLEWLQEFDPDLIVIDEAHHAVAGAWAKIIEACPRALLLGVTATPRRTNGQGLGDVFEVLVLGPSMADLIAAGWLVPFRIIVPPLIADLSKIRRKGGDLDPDALADALDHRSITGDAIEHYTRIAPGRPAIVFASTLKHADHVAAQFREEGWRFEVIHGTIEDTRRDALIKGLADGTFHGLVSKDLISEGTDIPAAEVAIFLRDTESETFFLQAAGRVARPVYAPGFDLSTVEGRVASIAASAKPFGILIDHVGVVGRVVEGVFIAKHGRPHDVREWDLKGTRRRKAADAEPVVQCPGCYVTDPSMPVCACGHVFADAELEKIAARRLGKPPEQVDGVLLELDEAAEMAARLEARRAQAQSKTVEDMVASTGMDPKRAAHIIAAREEKDRLRRSLADVCERWYRACRPGNVPHSRALRDAFGFGMADVSAMKPKALRDAVERVTAELLRLQFGDPSNDNAIQIRPAGARA